MELEPLLPRRDIHGSPCQLCPPTLTSGNSSLGSSFLRFGGSVGGTLGVSLSVAILGVLRGPWVTHLSIVLYFLKVAMAL